VTYLGTTLPGKKELVEEQGGTWYGEWGGAEDITRSQDNVKRQGVLIWLTAIFRGTYCTPRATDGLCLGRKHTVTGSAIEPLASFSFSPRNGYQSGYCHVPWTR
jgi:hypothetical protein